MRGRMDGARLGHGGACLARVMGFLMWRGRVVRRGRCARRREVRAAGEWRAIVRAGGGGTAPACHRARSCSRRPKMRAKMAAMAAWMAAGIQTQFSRPACASLRRPANCSPREGVWFSMPG